MWPYQLHCTKYEAKENLEKELLHVYQLHYMAVCYPTFFQIYEHHDNADSYFSSKLVIIIILCGFLILQSVLFIEYIFKEITFLGRKVKI